MKKLKRSNLSLILLGTSLVTFAIVIGLGALIKRLELTIGLLSLPIIIGITSAITSVVSIIKKDERKLQLVVTGIISTMLTVFMLLFMLMLRGLWRLN